MVLSCGPLTVITLLYFALSGGRHSGGPSICLTIRIRSYYQLSVTHFQFFMNRANDQRALLHRVCSGLLVLFSQFHGTVLVMGSTIHLLMLMHYTAVIALTGHIIFFMLNLVDLNNSYFYKWRKNNLTDTEFNTAWSLLDIIFITEGYSVLLDNFTLTKSQITDIIATIST
jgi:hypothetical protein